MLTHPLFLIGLVAVAIPIVIHLLQLRRYKKVYFSNVDMLEELQNEDRKQRNLRQLLILAARILAIVFLVLAFCQPVIKNRDSQLKSGGTVVSVYVDNSYSMECGGMDGSLLESARQKAREIAAAYKPGDQF
ncbi:MAG: BatA domain-containing protein, partial [Bacteroidales bacterium]|nr:BatA domain-containing protein [Bacteroidales bacterium]